MLKSTSKKLNSIFKYAAIIFHVISTLNCPRRTQSAPFDFISWAGERRSIRKGQGCSPYVFRGLESGFSTSYRVQPRKARKVHRGAFAVAFRVLSRKKLCYHVKNILSHANKTDSFWTFLVSTPHPLYTGVRIPRGGPAAKIATFSTIHLKMKQLAATLTSLHLELFLQIDWSSQPEMKNSMIIQLLLKMQL